MKKIISSAAALCLCITLMGCSSAEEADEQEQVVEEDNAIALSMTYPKSFGDMQYMVAGDWEELSDETQATYYTGYSTILISSVEGSDFEPLVSSMLATEGISEEGTEDPMQEDLPEGEGPEEMPEGEEEEDLPEWAPEEVESSTETEDIEVGGVSGIKRTMVVDERNIELFAFFVGDKTYCIVAIYDDISEQSKAYEATDTLVSSITFNYIPEFNEEEGDEVVVE